MGASFQERPADCLLVITSDSDSDTEQPLTHSSKELVETVDTAVTLMESVMAVAAHLSSVEQHVTVAIKNSMNFYWISCACLCVGENEMALLCN
jgi:hypothetical protein